MRDAGIVVLNIGIFMSFQIVGEWKTKFECCSFLITLQENAKSIGKVLNCMYECIKLTKRWKYCCYDLKIPVILHSIEFEILTCTIMLKIAFPGL